MVSPADDAPPSETPLIEGVNPVVVGLCHSPRRRSIESDGHNADIVKSDFGVKCHYRPPDTIHVSERGSGNTQSPADLLPTPT